MVPKVTVDSNCLIALEENESTAPHWRELIELHERGDIRLQVCAISASERPRKKTTFAVDPNRTRNFNLFEQRLHEVGLRQAELILPLCYLDVAFFDKCLLGGSATILLDREVHQILWPTLPFEYSVFEAVVNANKLLNDEQKKAKLGDWLNHKCDTLAFWTHIFYGGGLFVSDDSVFNKSKKPSLLKIAGGDIVRPRDAVQRLSTGSRLTAVPDEVAKFIRLQDHEVAANVPKVFINAWKNKARYDQALGAQAQKCSL